MGQIYVEGLGQIQIKSNTPSPEEEAAIVAALNQPPDVPADTPPTVAPGATQRQAEDQSMNALDAFTQEGGAAGRTMGIVSRPSMTMAGGTVGGALGAPAGPAGMVAGAGLGAAAGSLVFDTIDDAVRHFTGAKREPEGVLDPSKRAAESAMEEVMFTGGAAALGPVFRAFKPLMGKVLGAGGKAALADKAAAQGIDLGVIQATESKAVKGTARVLGVFPFVGTPIKKAAQKSAGQVETRFNDILNDLAPNASINELGVDLTNAAKSGFKDFKSVSGALYENFEKRAAALSEPDIFPTDSIRSAAEQMLSRQAEGSIVLQSGKPLKSASDPVGEFVAQLSELPDRLSVGQIRQLQRDLRDLMGKAAADGFDISRGVEIKKALEQSLNNPDVSRLAADEADEVVSALTKANKFYAERMADFETATAKKFGRVDKKMFGAGAFKAGSINADEVFNGIYNAKSPQALEQLRKLVGDKEFNKATRQYLEDAFKGSFDATKGRAIPFNAEKFIQQIGLDSPAGRSSLEQALKGSKVTVKEIEDFVEVAQKAGDLMIPDTSVFLQRRITLGGLRNIMGAFAMGAAGVSNPISTGAAIILARKAGKVLTDPEQLRAMTRVLDDTIDMKQRRALLVRLARLSFEEDRPTGRLKNGNQ